MRSTLLSFIFFLENGYLRIGQPSNYPKISGGLAKNINDFLDLELRQKQKLTQTTINDYQNSLRILINILKRIILKNYHPNQYMDFLNLLEATKKQTVIINCTSTRFT